MSKPAYKRAPEPATLAAALAPFTSLRRFGFHRVPQDRVTDERNVADMTHWLRIKAPLRNAQGELIDLRAHPQFGIWCGHWKLTHYGFLDLVTALAEATPKLEQVVVGEEPYLWRVE